MKEPFFSGLVVLKEWKVLENCLRVWKRSHSSEETPLGRVLTDKYSMFYHTRKTQALLQMLSQGQCTHGDKRTQQDLKGAGTRASLLQSPATCSAPAGFIAHGFTVTTEVLSNQPKNGGMRRSGSEGCLQNNGDPNLTYFKGARFHFHHWCLLVCPSSNILPK